MSILYQQFRSVRRVSVPLVAVRTPDPAATVATLTKNGDGNAPPVFGWDIVTGLRPFNSAAADVPLEVDPILTANPVEALILASKLPTGSILFMHNAPRILGNDAVVQAVWNLRDKFKADQRTLVMLGTDFVLPPELAQDVLVLDEPLPSDDELKLIVLEQYESASLPAPDTTTAERAVDALSGLAAFPAEQATAISLTKKGLDLPGLWDRKRSMIEQTPGLSVWRGDESFSGIGGCESVKTFLERLFQGNAHPRCIVFVDEIEKALAGSGSSGGAADTSGVSQGMVGGLLTWMQDKRAAGLIFVGPPGSGKSMMAKAAGNLAGTPTIALDVSGMKASLVGQSEANLRTGLKVIDAVSQGASLWIATCNSLAVLPPELRRRFSLGIWFFDLPTAQERSAIWSIYCDAFKLTDTEFPADDGWTGAEIRTCCEIAWRLRSTIVEASRYIVPVSRSSADAIQKLREQASGRFLSASSPGLYRYDRIAGAPTARSITLGEVT